MDQKEEKKAKIFNSIHTCKKAKRKYFKVEKNKNNSLINKEKELKKIFRTQKEYHILKRKIQRENSSSPDKTNKFTTETNEDGAFASTGENDKENSFLVLKIVPKKLKLIKPIKRDINSNINGANMFEGVEGSNSKCQFPLEKKNNEQNFSWIGAGNERDKIINGNNNININTNNEYKMKLQFVYFYYIKNLCKYINQSFIDLAVVDQNFSLEAFLYQMYQSLQILDRKINNFKLIQKNNFHMNKEEFLEIQSLKDNLLFMKNALNNTMSQNLINIYINIENFCNQFSY